MLPDQTPKLGSRPRPGRSLAERAPEVAAEWHPTFNGSLAPGDVAGGSPAKAWWLCPTCDLEYRATIASRTYQARPSGCPSCAVPFGGPPKFLARHRDAAATRAAELGLEPRAHRPQICVPTLAEAHPELLAEWDTERNGDLDPSILTPGSHQEVWWRCSADASHPRWRTLVVDRAVAGHGCRACMATAARRPVQDRSLAAVRPDLLPEWNVSRNGSTTPRDVAASSQIPVWWTCRTCSHEWETTPNQRNNLGRGCPACAGVVVSEQNALPTIFPEREAQWHPTRNGDLRPEDVSFGMRRRVWWQHAACGYEWQESIRHRTGRGGKTCPQCSGAHRTEANNLAAVRPDVAAEWHPRFNGSLTPAEVTWGSARSIWWKCDACGFDWETRVHRRTDPKRGSGCPVCADRPQLRPYIKRQEQRAREMEVSLRDSDQGRGRRGQAGQSRCLTTDTPQSLADRSLI